MKTSLRLTAIASIAVAYLAAAKLGFTVALTAEQVTPIFPPAGLALSALLVFGPRVWPGILLGAFLANVTTHEPVLVALAIAGGNTLEAIIAARLLRRFARFEQTLDTLQHALGLVVFGALASTLVAATIGVTSLCLGGVQPWTAFGPLWLTWWLGDAAGDLLIVPALLTWYAWRDAPRRRIGELALLLVGLAVTCAGVFAGPFRDAAAAHHSLEYIVFPFLIWAAIRFGTAGAAAANIVTASIAIWGAVQGFGPYAVGDVAGHLLFLQLFLAVVATTGLLLGATISERTAALRRRNAEHAVTRVLADAASGEEAIQRIIDVINGFDWDIGLWWSVDPDGATAALPGHPMPACHPLSAVRTHQPGHGLRAGRTVAGPRMGLRRTAMDPRRAEGARVAATPGRRRRRTARRLRVPNLGRQRGARRVRVLSRSVRRPDDDLLWMFTAIGAQVGQFLARKRMEQQIQESEERKAGMLNAALDCIITVDRDAASSSSTPRRNARSAIGSARSSDGPWSTCSCPKPGARALPRATRTLPDVRSRRASAGGASRWSGCAPTGRSFPPSSRSRGARRRLVRCSPGSFATSPGKSEGRTSSRSAPRTTA